MSSELGVTSGGETKVFFQNSKEKGAARWVGSCCLCSRLVLHENLFPKRFLLTVKCFYVSNTFFLISQSMQLRKELGFPVGIWA